MSHHHDHHDHESAVTVSGLRRALDDGEFELWFQPKVRLSDNLIVGVEGLARWRHPAAGILSPGAFLAPLGQAGLLDRFTSQMIDEAIRFAGAVAKVSDPIEVAVNLGPRSFLTPGLAGSIADQLEIHQVEPNHLVIEITEEDLLQESPEATAAFEQLGALGVQLSIDDFGTGYSSLARLRRLPVDELKIDQEFVGALGTDDGDTVIVRTIIELARLLKQVTVAEGIETVDQLHTLRRLGCSVGQGWLFAPPMEPELLLDLLRESKHIDAPTPIDLRPAHRWPDVTIPTDRWAADGIRLPTDTSELHDALITDRQQLELLRAVLDIVPCAAFIKDQRGRFVEANAKACAELGVASSAELAGRSDFDFYGDIEARRYQADDLGVLSSGEPLIDRWEDHRRPDGSWATLRTTKVPIRNSQSEIIGLLGYSVEIATSTGAATGT